ncbi:MAG: peptidase [Pseudomonadota bacterium]
MVTNNQPIKILVAVYACWDNCFVKFHILRKKMMRTYLKFGIVIVLLFFNSIIAQADYGYDHDKAKSLREAGEILPLQLILKNVHKLHPGRVLEVELETKKDKIFYEIELLLSNGHVVELLYDAKTGQYLSTEKED